MNRKQYLNRLNKILTKVDKDITKAILLTHEFKDSHPEIKDLSGILNYTNEDRALDDIAWIFNIRGNDVKNNPVNLAYAAITLDLSLIHI